MTLFAIFLVSMLFAPRRSVVTKAVTRARGRASLARELRAEQADHADHPGHESDENDPARIEAANGMRREVAR